MLMEYPYYCNTFIGKVKRIWHILMAQIMLYKLCIEIRINPGIINDKNEFIRFDRWTTESKDTIVAKGYAPCVGMHDNLLWIGIPQFIKIVHGEEFDISQTDKNGQFIWSQDTPATLNDAMSSEADKDFFRGMGRAHTLLNMDIQTITMIAIVGVGAIVGLWFLGVF